MSTAALGGRGNLATAIQLPWARLDGLVIIMMIRECRPQLTLLCLSATAASLRLESLDSRRCRRSVRPGCRGIQLHLAASDFTRPTAVRACMWPRPLAVESCRASAPSAGRPGHTGLRPGGTSGRSMISCHGIASEKHHPSHCRASGSASRGYFRLPYTIAVRSAQFSCHFSSVATGSVSACDSKTAAKTDGAR